LVDSTEKPSMHDTSLAFPEPIGDCDAIVKRCGVFASH
jgi:hypothetical protein